MSRLSTPGLLGRHLRTAPGAPIAVALLVFVLSALTVFGPLALTALSDAALRYRLDVGQPGRARREAPRSPSRPSTARGQRS